MDPTHATTSPPEQLGEPVDDELRAQIVETLSTAFAAVQASPILIELEMDEEGSLSVASIRVDRGRGLLEAAWVQPTGRGSEITTLNVVVDGKAYLKSTDSPAAAAALNFVEVGERTRDGLLDGVFTGYSRLGPSLDRMLVLLEALPFRASTSATSSGERLTVSLSPTDVVAYLEQNDLERTGGRVPDAPIRWEFVLEGTNLVGLEASGTQFHDGEALDLTASLTYTPIEPFELEPPPVDP